MLTMRFNLCQGSFVRRREISELSACTQDVSASAFPNEHVDAGLAHNRLEREDVCGRTGGETDCREMD